jgi:hypothetical protein
MGGEAFGHVLTMNGIRTGSDEEPCLQMVALRVITQFFITPAETSLLVQHDCSFVLEPPLILSAIIDQHQEEYCCNNRSSDRPIQIAHHACLRSPACYHEAERPGL